MKKKQVKINRLIITSKKDIFSVFDDFLSKGWRRIEENLFKFLFFYIKIEKIKEKMIIDIYRKDSGVVTPAKLTIFSYFSFFQIKSWIKRWVKDLKRIDENCDIINTYTMIESKRFTILILKSVLLFLLGLIIVIIIAIIITILRT